VLQRLAELPISDMHVERITERLGHERADERDARVEQMKAGQLSPAHAQPPRVAAIHLDAGKIQMRSEDGPPGVREPRWSDTKVACLLTYTAPPGDVDPQPQPPAAFLDPPHVMRLCQEIQQVRSDPTTRPTAAKTRAKPAAESVVETPHRLVRTAVATMEKAETFGWMVAAEAMERGFYDAPHRAVVGDGGNWIEPLGQLHFPGWVQVLDFLHLLVHLYAAATAAYRGQGKSAWRLYERMLRAAWGGNVAAVLADMKEQARDDHSRKIVAKALAHARNDADRMELPPVPPPRPARHQRGGGVSHQAVQPAGQGHREVLATRRRIPRPPPPRPRRWPGPPPPRRINGGAPSMRVLSGCGVVRATPTSRPAC